MRTKSIVSLLFLIIIFLLLSSFTHCQDTVWTNYTYTGKLMDILADSNYLWIATDGGLIKYNKLTEECNTYNRANVNLPDNHLRSLAKDREGDIWLSTHYGGIGCFNGESCTIYNSQNSGLPTDQWNMKIMIDNENNKWVGSLRWLVKYNDNEWLTWETGSPISAYYSINDLLMDTDSSLWIAASWGLGRLTSDSIRYYPEITSPLSSLLLDNENNLWIGSKSNGIYKYEGETFINYNTSNSSIPSNVVSSLTYDFSGSIWIGTNNGLVKYLNNQFIVFNTDNSNIPWNHVYRIEPDEYGILWLGDFLDGVVKYDGIDFERIELIDFILTTNWIINVESTENSIFFLTKYKDYLYELNEEWSIVDSASGLRTNDINTIISDDDNGLFIGGNKTILSYKAANNNWIYYYDFMNDNITHILPDSPNVFWLATNNGLKKYNNGVIISYNTENSPLISNNIGDLVFDTEGNLWGTHGTMGNGIALFKFNGTDFEIMSHENSDLPDYHILDIEFDSDNNLWAEARSLSNVVGIEWGGGLLKFDGMNWTEYNIYNSNISSNTVFDIEIDSSDNIWIGTCAGGLDKYDRNDTWESYNVTNSGIAFNTADNINIAPDNRLWIAHYYAGISMVDFNHKPNKINEPVVYSNIEIDIFPNPAKEEINIIINRKFEGTALLKVYDLTGKLIYDNIIKNNSGKSKLKYSVSEFNITSNGIYFIEVSTKTKLYNKKIIVIK